MVRHVRYILLSDGLLDQLRPRAVEAVMAHEIAHVRRRDPWIRVLETVATSLYWWHPAAWLARR